MARVIIINVTGLDWEFIERLENPNKLTGLNRLQYRASLLPPSPPDPVLSSAMCASGLGCGEHGIFQSASLFLSDALFSLAKEELMKYHISRFLSKNKIASLWYRGLYLGDCFISDEVLVKGLAAGAPVNSQIHVLDSLTEPSSIFELEKLDDGCEIKGLGKIEELKIEQLDRGRRLKVFYKGKNVLLERGNMSPKFCVTLNGKSFRFRVLFPIDGVKPYFIICDFDPSAANSKLSNPEELAWVIEEEMGGPLNFGRWAEFEAARLGLLDIAYFVAELSEHFNRSLQFLLSAIKWERYQFVYCWDESFELARRLFTSFSDFNHERFDPEKASVIEKLLIKMLLILDSTIEKILTLAESKKWLVMLISDYGLAPYRIGFDLNRWLVNENFATGELGPDGKWTFDWKNTRAFSIGPLIYINLYGQTTEGVVMPGREENDLIREIIERLRNLECPLTCERVVRTARRVRKIYSGKYIFNGPALVIGLFPSYRISSGSDVFFLNTTFDGAGRLGLDPEVVRGFILSNLKILPEARSVDIFPTVIKFFGLKLPRRVEGKCLLIT